MTKQEQIEEMAKHGCYDGCANSVVLSREEYQELEDLRINHAKDLINANNSYEEHIKDIKLEYSNHIKNLEEIIDRQSKDLNSQADRLIDLREELENKGKETAKVILEIMSNIIYEMYGEDAPCNYNDIDEYMFNNCRNYCDKNCTNGLFANCWKMFLKAKIKEYGVEVEE